jgi:hypothetical protein
VPGAVVLHAPGILSPEKGHSKGRAQGHVAARSAQAPPLDCDLPRPDLGTYQEDGKADGRAARVKPKQR